jgi:hypothetical protein
MIFNNAYLVDMAIADSIAALKTSTCVARRSRQTGRRLQT